MNEDYDKAKKITLILLGSKSKPTFEDIRSCVHTAVTTLSSTGSHQLIDEDRMAREIQSLVTVTVGDSTILEDTKLHREWLLHKKISIKWKFWNRYKEYLEQVKLLPHASVNKLDMLTDEILSHIEDPEREGSWDCRGMVVGRVQSGKTANYTGLICKAIDAGYKVVVILAGLQNDLRSQTQLRIDEGVLGFDTKQDRNIRNHQKRFGVGSIPGAVIFPIQSLTSSAENGDFKKSIAQQLAGNFGGDPFILVVKKNARVLDNMIQWALSVRSEHTTESNKPIIPNIPILVIDDEADNASINTRTVPTDESGIPLPEYDVTKINQKIRLLLKSFSKSSYVGYTATPFANIFISYTAKTESYGDDIFPRNFIVNMPAPSNYIGPAQLFGISLDDNANSTPLPIIREVDDYDSAFPIRHKKDHKPEQLPKSLKEAIRSFVLVCAARRAAGQLREHNSMMVHVTRYVDVQGITADLIQDEISYLKLRLENGDGNKTRTIEGELKELWETDFVPTTQEFINLHRFSDYDIADLSWNDIKGELNNAASKIVVKKLNNSARDTLDYIDHKESGINIIAVGGDKLSRGLTLEGLSISYYLRATRLYDTLMQMGRWFGYRPGYANLCRLYTTSQLIQWYNHVTYASELLLEDFNDMAARGMTPEDYGLKVRSSDEGLRITSLSKMRAGQPLKLGLDDDIVEIVYHPADSLISEQNISSTDRFLHSLGKPEKHEDLIWKHVPAELVQSYIENFATKKFSIKADPSVIAGYIAKQTAKGELVDWTVVLISPNKKNGKTGSIGGHTVGLTGRAADYQKIDDKEFYVINRRRLISPGDEGVDLGYEDRERAQYLYGKELNELNPSEIRNVRSPKKGLLLIYYLNLQIKINEVFEQNEWNRVRDFSTAGFAVSFPASETAEKVEYVINEVEADKYDD